jgi:hypothetical protein
MLNEDIYTIINNDKISFQIRMDILDVYFDCRKGARIICKVNEEVERIVNSILKLNLNISVGKGLVPIYESNSLFKDHFEINSNQILNGIPLYLSKEQDYADKLRSYDESMDDKNFGKLLSYPPCCINYIKLNKKVPTLIESFNFLVQDNKYNVWCWPVASISDSSLISHFPCSYNCIETEILSKKRFNYLCKFASKDLVNKIIKYHSVYYYLEDNSIKTSIEINDSFISPNISINEFCK